MRYIFLLAGWLLAFTACRQSTQPISKNSPVETLYHENCAGCHGEKASKLRSAPWKHGESRDKIRKSIAKGYPELGMPAWDGKLSDTEIDQLTDYLLKLKGQPLDTKEIKPNNSSVGHEVVVDGLDVPWGLAFLPDGSMLITEREGRLLHFQDGQINEIAGFPDVYVRGQGGLMDVVLHPQCEVNGWIYFSYAAYAKPGKGSGGGTTILRGKLEGNTLVSQEELFHALPNTTSGRHFGSRIAFDQQGYLFFSVGERGHRPNAQDLNNACGKIHRIHDDGRIPKDNPFVGQEGKLPSIWTYGNRNPQGLRRHPGTGDIWSHEHGPKGGDELNLIQKGHNYGWPVISYGTNYDGTSFTDETVREGMDQPVTYWVPSIAPCGMGFLSDDTRYPGWKYNLFVGSLSFRYLHRCEIVDNRVAYQEKLLDNIGRVRDIIQGPDGFLYVAVEDPGMIVKLVKK